ncbi:hypothetical protein [Collinsella sp. AF38-3AC]|uniref:hypothetical protein n=1 Tax=Collinsella sp. AF38-3AC TaxID=2292015 RepID=UPI000E53875B|nr:hypothetical protein [Collinsella sp. AF38-3AC]RHL25386.1 hypothetical protein DW029_02835 [Collinsella sp. AF38-3AC]
MDIDIQETGIKPDPKGNVELVRFGSTAILFCGGGEPFMVAKGYDGKTGEWSGNAVRVDDLSVAWDIADPEIIEDATVKWTRTDVADILEGKGIEANDWNIDAVVKTPDLENSPSLLGEMSKDGGRDYLDLTIAQLCSIGALDVPEGFRLEEGLDDIAERMDEYCAGGALGDIARPTER